MMDHRRDRVEESEMLHPRRLTDAGRQRGRSKRAGGHDRHAVGRQRVDPLAHDRDVGMRRQRGSDAA